jgi:hypothetical protein
MGIARNIARLIPNGSGELPTANLQASATPGLVKTGSLNISAGAGRTYLDIPNCFTSLYDNYVVHFDLYNAATLNQSTGLMMAIENTGAGVDGGGLFTGSTFTSGHSHHMRFAQLGTSNVGSQAETWDWPKLMGTGDNGNTLCRFNGRVVLNDVFNNSVKYGNCHGMMNQNAGVYTEHSGFLSLNSHAGRGLRMWYGSNVLANGTVAVNSYGKITVYGVTK